MTRSVPVGKRLSPMQVYERALATQRLWARDGDGDRRIVPVSGWRSHSIAGDESVLARCQGSTLDVGCGPGRLAAALKRRDVPALGIDISRVAVALARSIGANVIRRSVFEPLPRTGEWHCVLLADGNIGIGGDPLALMKRVRELLRPGGAAYVEVGAPGSRTRTRWMSLEDSVGSYSTSFPWSEVAAHDITPLAREAGLHTSGCWSASGRWFAELLAPPAGPCNPDDAHVKALTSGLGV